VSEKNSLEFGAAISGVIVAVVVIAAVYALTVAQFQGSPGGSAGSPEAIAERIKPVGKVVVAGSAAATAAAAPAPASAAGGGGSGEAIYTKACFACHGTGAANAPKLGDKAAWEPRLSVGVDGLLKSAVAGKNAMPPRGTCADCSDGDLRAAIEFMVSKVQ